MPQREVDDLDDAMWFLCAVAALGWAGAIYWAVTG